MEINDDQAINRGASVDVRGAANVSDATGGIVAANETIAPNMNYLREDPGQ